MEINKQNIYNGTSLPLEFTKYHVFTTAYSKTISWHYVDEDNEEIIPLVSSDIEKGLSFGVIDSYKNNIYFVHEFSAEVSRWKQCLTCNSEDKGNNRNRVLEDNFCICMPVT